MTSMGMPWAPASSRAMVPGFGLSASRQAGPYLARAPVGQHTGTDPGGETAAQLPPSKRARLDENSPALLVQQKASPPLNAVLCSAAYSSCVQAWSEPTPLPSRESAAYGQVTSDIRCAQAGGPQRSTDSDSHGCAGIAAAARTRMLEAPEVGKLLLEARNVFAARCMLAWCIP